LEMGLARCTYPEGRVLERVTLDPPPRRTVRWYPDRDDTILYIAGDGRLYRYTFTGENGTRGHAARPQPIRWEADTPAAAQVRCQDLCRSSDPALGGRLLASLGSRSHHGEPDLWWLELSPDGGAIVAAGSMIEPEEEGAARRWDAMRLPAVGTTR